MRIEELLPPSGRQKQWLIQLENGDTFPVGEGALIDFSLHVGMELDAETIARLRQTGHEAALRQQAMDMLLRRPYSKGELARKLSEKFPDANAEGILAVCDWAAEIGLMHEESYAAMIVRRAQERGYGLYKIKSELHHHQIPRELWDTALAEMQESEEIIDRYLTRHLKSTDAKALKKASDALARRGFSWSEISAGIRRFGSLEDEFD